MYLLKVNNRSTRTSYETCSKLTIKTPKRGHWRRSCVFMVNFEHVIADWVTRKNIYTQKLYIQNIKPPKILDTHI